MINKSESAFSDYVAVVIHPSTYFLIELTDQPDRRYANATLNHLANLVQECVAALRKGKVSYGDARLVAPGDIHSRVSAALSQHLLHIDADQDLPPAIVNDFIQFKNSLHSEPGQLLESMRERSEMELEKVAQKIVILYEKVLTAGAR